MAKPRRKPAPIPVINRVAPKIEVAPSGCWEWTASRRRDGYGRIRIDGIEYAAHRVTYELFVGPIPDGLHIDHLCRNRGCVNPDHLEPVTHAENVRRGESGAWQRAKTHCKHGHEFTAENTITSRDGAGRACRACSNRRNREYRQRQAAA